jgi:hypothetical protein
LIVAEWTFKGKLSDGIARVCHVLLLATLDHRRPDRMRKDKATLVKGSERGTGKRVGDGGRFLRRSALE